MPLNVRRFCISYFFGLFIFAFISVDAQTQPASTPIPQQTTAATTATPIRTPTTAEVMRDRLSKAKAFIAVRNYGAAIYELENIRRETGDTSVNAVANVLLMNSYIEQGDYKRAQDMLNEFFRLYKSNSANGSLYYSAVAAQAVKTARNQVERYRTLGLTVSDRNLPLEAVNDIERMRELVETVVTQSKELAADKVRGAAAMALMEEAVNSRAMLARDDYDARRWKNEAAEWREEVASSRSVIINATDGTAVQTAAQPVYMPTQAPPPNTNPTIVPASQTQNGTISPSTAFKQAPVEQTPAVQQVNRPQPEPIRATEGAAASNDQQRNRVAEQAVPQQNTPAEEKKITAAPSSGSDAASGPMNVGSSLIAYATRQQAPVYPMAAKNMRAAGVVRVEVTVDENGDVTEIQKASGPTLLVAAAKDAIKKWKFKPFVRDGQPVKANGFVNFNFSL